MQESNFKKRGFFKNNENTMNAYTASSALKAYGILFNQYSSPMLGTDFNEILKNKINEIFKLFDTSSALPNESRLTPEFIYERAVKLDRENEFGKQMPLSNVMFLVMSAIMDEKVQWIDASILEERLIKLYGAFEEALNEANCDTGVRNKIFSVLHRSYPGIIMLGEINSDLTNFAVEYYQEKLKKMTEVENISEAKIFELITVLIRDQTGDENLSESENESIASFYVPEDLKKHLTKTMLGILGKERYEQLKKSESGIETMIQQQVDNIPYLPLPIPSGKEVDFLKLKTLIDIKIKEQLPVAVKTSFNRCKTMTDLADSLPCQAFLSCLQLKKDIERYINPQYLTIGETEQFIVKVAHEMHKNINALEKMLAQENLDENNLKETFNALIQDEEKLQKAIDFRAKEKDMFMENSLAVFFSIKNKTIENKAQKVRFFQKLTTLFSEKKLEVTDSILQQWSQQQVEKENNTAVARYLTPEQMTRLFLTAIMTTPCSWTPLFAEGLQEAVDLFNKPVEDNHLLENFKKTSCPPMFLKQLEWLISIKKTPVDTEDPLPALTFKLPMPCNIGLPMGSTRDSLKDNYPLHPIALLAEPMWLHQDDIPVVLTLDTLMDCLRQVMPKQQLAFFKKLKSYDLSAIIKDRDKLAYALHALPQNARTSFLQDALGAEHVQSIIKWASYLGLLLRELPQDSRMFFIEKTLGAEHVKSFMEESGLAEVLRELPQDSRMLFIEKTLGVDFVKSIIKNASKLGYILSKLPENTWTTFVRDMLGVKHVKSLIKDRDGLAEVLRELPQDSRISFIEKTLGVELVKSIIKSVSDLGCVLSRLPENTWTTFTQDTLGEDFVKSIIEDKYDLEWVLNSLPQESKLSFIRIALKENPRLFQSIIKQGYSKIKNLKDGDKINIGIFEIKLENYIHKVNSQNKEDDNINFSSESCIDNKSQEQSHEEDYLLAKAMLQDLKSGKPLSEVFSRKIEIEQKKTAVLGNKELNRFSFFGKNKIHQDLRDILVEGEEAAGNKLLN